MSIAVPVSRTATDALRAKLSALSVGFDPIPIQGDVYEDILRRIGRGIDNGSQCDEGVAAGGNGKRRNRHRRQTPLVNAGYAARVRAVGSVLSRWVPGVIDSGDDRCDGVVNIVLLGCGLDALGLWSASLVGDNARVCVFEVDCEDVCASKAAALLSEGLIALPDRDVSSSSSSPVVLSGTVVLPPPASGGGGASPPNAASPAPRYALLSADLRRPDSVRRALSEAGLDASRPTAAVSELAMAYLGRDGTDSLMRYVSSGLCAAAGSLFLAFEPIGVSVVSSGGGGVHGGPAVVTVAGGYAEEYLGRFQAKLIRGRHYGNSLNNKDRKNTDEMLHPLGTDPANAASRMLRCGFNAHRISCCHAGDAAVSYGRMMAPRLEYFDEHAALALHLRCYALACAFAPGVDGDFVKKICPWSSPTNTIQQCASELLTKTTLGGINVTVAPIQCCDQEQVRRLFQATYSHLFEEYPAVKKMVKTALKNDLSGKPVLSNSGKSICQEEKEKTTSPIFQRYKTWGGGFWVATINVSCSPDKGEKNNSHQVLGCIGLRPCSDKEGSSRELGSCKAYEVHRLAVDAEYRGAGIGRLLLEIAEKFSVERSKVIGSVDPISFLATTPSLLEGANHFYSSSGFHLQDDFTLRNMRMKTYVKRLLT